MRPASAATALACLLLAGCAMPPSAPASDAEGHHYYKLACSFHVDATSGLRANLQTCTYTQQPGQLLQQQQPAWIDCDLDVKDPSHGALRAAIQVAMYDPDGYFHVYNGAYGAEKGAQRDVTCQGNIAFGHDVQIAYESGTNTWHAHRDPGVYDLEAFIECRTQAMPWGPGYQSGSYGCPQQSYKQTLR